MEDAEQQPLTPEQQTAENRKLMAKAMVKSGEMGGFLAKEGGSENSEIVAFSSPLYEQDLDTKATTYSFLVLTLEGPKIIQLKRPGNIRDEGQYMDRHEVESAIRDMDRQVEGRQGVKNGFNTGVPTRPGSSTSMIALLGSVDKDGFNHDAYITNEGTYVTARGNARFDNTQLIDADPALVDKIIKHNLFVAEQKHIQAKRKEEEEQAALRAAQEAEAQRLAREEAIRNADAQMQANREARFNQAAQDQAVLDEADKARTEASAAAEQQRKLAEQAAMADSISKALD